MGGSVAGAEVPAYLRSKGSVGLARFRWASMRSSGAIYSQVRWVFMAGLKPRPFTEKRLSWEPRWRGSVIGRLQPRPWQKHHEMAPGWSGCESMFQRRDVGTRSGGDPGERWGIVVGKGEEFGGSGGVAGPSAAPLAKARTASLTMTGF